MGSLSKKQIAGLLLIILMGIALIAGLILVGKPQDIRKRAQGTSEISVTLVPETAKLHRNQTTKVHIRLTDNTNPLKLPLRLVKIQIAGLEMQFTPAELSVSNLSCGASLQNAFIKKI